MSKGKKKTVRFKLFILLLVFVVLGGGAFAFYMYTTPQITLEGSKEITVTMKEGYKEPGATATFSFHDISDHVKISSDVNDKKVGTYEVTYTVDYLEKTATAVRTVNVIDREPPEITLTEGDHVSVQTAGSFEDPGVTAIDDSDGDVTANVEAKGLVDVFNKGDYEIEYKVSDSYGNEATAVRTVTVEGEPAREVKGVIYLTFDDGPSTTVTPKILKTLEK